MKPKARVRMTKGTTVSPEERRALAGVATVKVKKGRTKWPSATEKDAARAWSFVGLALAVAKLGPALVGKEGNYVRVHELVTSVVDPSAFWNREPFANLSEQESTRAVTWLRRELSRVDEKFKGLPADRVSALLLTFTGGKSRRGSASAAVIAAALIVDARALGACVSEHEGHDGRDGAIDRMRKSIERAVKKHPVDTKT